MQGVVVNLLATLVSLHINHLTIVSRKKRVTERRNVEQLLHHRVHVADASEILQSNEAVGRSASVLRGNTLLLLLSQLQDEWIPEVFYQRLNDSRVRVVIDHGVEEGVCSVAGFIRVALVHL